MTKKTAVPFAKIETLYRVSLDYDAAPANEHDHNAWDKLNEAIATAASLASKTYDNDRGDIEHYPGGAACFPYIVITAATWHGAKMIHAAIYQAMIDNGGSEIKNTNIEINV